MAEGERGARSETGLHGSISTKVSSTMQEIQVFEYVGPRTNHMRQWKPGNLDGILHYPNKEREDCCVLFGPQAAVAHGRPDLRSRGKSSRGTRVGVSEPIISGASNPTLTQEYMPSMYLECRQS